MAKVELRTIQANQNRREAATQAQLAAIDPKLPDAVDVSGGSADDGDGIDG